MDNGVSTINTIYTIYIINYFINSLLRKLIKKSFKMKFSDKGIMSVSGTIRGSIAFGLAVSLKLENEFNKSILVSSTLGLVMLTTLIFGAIMPFTIKFLKSFDKEHISNQVDLIEVLENKNPLDESSASHHKDQVVNQIEFDHPNSKELQLPSLEEPLQSRGNLLKKLNLNKWLLMIWCEFDYNYARPAFVYDFPHSVEQHDRLVEKISNIKLRK